LAQGWTWLATSVSRPRCRGLPSDHNRFASSCIQAPRPRVVLLCNFMASCNKPTVATPAFAGTANNKTRTRRLHRKHTEASYKHMKEKLLLIVQPLPKAVYAADLEEFRHSLYCKEVSPVLIHDKPPCTNQCMWCGIWTPLPTPPIIAVASTQQPLFQQLQACDKTVDALLEVCLCQVPSEPEMATDDTRTPLTSEHVGKQEQCTAIDTEAVIPLWTSSELSMYRLKRYCFKRTRICEVPETMPDSGIYQSSAPAPSPPQYYTDESNGECRTQ